MSSQSYSLKPFAALLLGATAIACPASARAQVVDIPTIVVSPSLSPIEASRVGSSLSVLTGEDIRNRGFNTVSDALRTLPGVAVSQSGTRGSLTQVRVRGAEANHLLVVIDGVAVNAGGDGGFDFADLPVDDIERLELLRGPQSGLYGANAHAGVLTIVTRSGRGLSASQVTARVEAGTQRTAEGALSVRGAAGPLYGAMTLTQGATQGFNIARAGSERDGARRRSATLKAGIDFTPDVNLEASFRHLDRSNGVDPQDPFSGLVFDRAGDRGTYADTIGRLEATVKLADGRWIHSAKWTGAQQDTQAFALGAQSFQSLGANTTLGYKSTLLADTSVFGGERHRFTVLLENRRETFRYRDALLAGPDVDFWRQGKTRRTTGLAGEYVLDLATATTLSAALRQDFNEPFKDEFTWRYSLSQQIGSHGTRLHASVGRAVTNPSYFELYGFSPTNFRGNASLVPESSIGWDAGIEQSFLQGRLTLDATYFRSRLVNEIVTTFLPSFQSTAVNLTGASRRQGIETHANWHATPWLSLSAGYTYTHSRDPDGRPEVRRPTHAASASATLSFLDSRAHATVNVVYNGAMPDQWFQFPVVTVRLPAFTTVGAILSYDVTRQLTAYVRAENVFNARYEEVFSYRSPGFTAVAGLKLRTGD